MRVRFVVDSDVHGGAEVYVGHLLNHLPARFECSLVASRPPPPRLLRAAAERGAPVALVDPVRGKLDGPRLARLGRALRAGRPDLVHVNAAIPTNNRHALAAGALLRTPLVVTVHLAAPIRGRGHRALIGRLYRRARATIAVSREIASQLEDELGVSPRAIRVVRNGVEPGRAARARDAAAPVRVGALGRLTRQKGFDLLVEAIRALRAGKIDVEAVVAGCGPERAALERQAAGAPVRFAGFVEDVPSFLEDLDVFCLPSRGEGLPFALLEAMSQGLPCVAARVGDVADAVGSAGILVAPEDVEALTAALREIALSAARRRELGAAARSRVRDRHSVDAMVAATAAVYDEALRG